MALEQGIPSQSQRCTLNFLKYFYFFLPGKKESVPTMPGQLFFLPVAPKQQPVPRTPVKRRRLCLRRGVEQASGQVLAFLGAVAAKIPAFNS